MRAYKLFRIRKDGTISSLFIAKRDRLPIDRELHAGYYPTEGFAPRIGWHAVPRPNAPHLSIRGRAWFHVDISDFERIRRPKSQGGLWYIAQWMKILGPVGGNR